MIKSALFLLFILVPAIIIIAAIFYFRDNSPNISVTNDSRAINSILISPDVTDYSKPEPSSVPTKSVNVNTIDVIVGDMTGYHEGCLEGQPKAFSWNRQPEADNPIPPNGYNAITYWGTIYADCAGNPATNTRVQVANIKAYVLLKSTGKWKLIQSQGNIAGCYYSGDWKDTDCSFNVRNESTGQSIKPKPNMLAHFYAAGERATYDNSDVLGAFVTGEARLIVDKANLPDDTGKAKLLMDVGGDWWQSATAPYPNNAQIGLGKFKYLTGNWRNFSMVLTKESYVKPVSGEYSHTINADAIKSNWPSGL